MPTRTVTHTARIEDGHIVFDSDRFSNVYDATEILQGQADARRIARQARRLKIRRTLMEIGAVLGFVLIYCLIGD